MKYFQWLENHALKVVVIFAGLLYITTMGYDFVYDDKIVIQDNQHITQGINRIPAIWTSNYLNGYQQFNDGLYRPLSPTVFNIEHAIWGDSSVGFHLVNLLFYALLCGVVYITFMLLFPSYQSAVFWGSILFAAHPLHTEVVANVKSLDEILALLFGVLAIRYSFNLDKTRNYLATIICFTLALFSKESAITFTLIIPLVYLFSEAKPTLQRKRIFLYLGLMGIAILWYFWRQYVISSMPREVDEGLFSATSNSIIGIQNPFLRLSTGIGLVGKYILMLFLPWPLFSDYSFNTIPEFTFSSWQLYLSWGLVLSLSIYTLIKLKTRNVWTLAILLFAIAIAPVSNIFIYIGTTFAERLDFAPSLCLIPVVIGVSKFKTPILRKVIPIICILFGGLTVYRSLEWKNNSTLFKADAERNQHSYRTQYNYATALSGTVDLEAKTHQQQADMLLAIEYYKKALAIFPIYADAMLNLANTYQKINDQEKSLAIYNELIEKKPDYNQAYLNKGLLLYKQKKYEEALPAFQGYIKGNGVESARANYLAGVSCGFLNRFEDAIYYMEASLRQNPNSWEALNFIGMAYGNLNNDKKAFEYFGKALQLNPNAEGVMANYQMAKSKLESQ